MRQYGWVMGLVVGGLWLGGCGGDGGNGFVPPDDQWYELFVTSPLGGPSDPGVIRGDLTDWVVTEGLGAGRELTVTPQRRLSLMVEDGLSLGLTNTTTPVPVTPGMRFAFWASGPGTLGGSGTGGASVVLTVRSETTLAEVSRTYLLPHQDSYAPALAAGATDLGGWGSSSRDIWADFAPDVSAAGSPWVLESVKVHLRAAGDDLTVLVDDWSVR